MTPADWVVLVAGIASIGWVNWYFFLAQRSTVTAFAETGAQSSAE